MPESDVVDSQPRGHFPEQFILSKHHVPAPRGWNTERFRGWQLQHDPTLQLRQLHDENGDRIGWLVGMPTLNGALVGDSLAIASHVDLYHLGGPWNAIDLKRSKLYVDSFGHLSSVYSTDAGVVSTNPEFIPGAPPDKGLTSLMDIPAKDNWFPFGLTPKQGVRRLQPNHCLDLVSWQAHRHWPDAVLVGEEWAPISVEEAAETVARVVKQNIEAIAQHYPLKLGLTAGYSTRLLLACSRAFTKELECVSHYFHPSTDELDLRVVRVLERIFGLKVTTLHERPSTERQREEWLSRTGRSAAGPNYEYVGTLSQDTDDHPTLTGHGGSVLKGEWYQGTSKSLRFRPTGATLLDCLQLPSNEAVIAAAERWIREVPSDRPEVILDLCVAEQRGGSWAGVLRHGTPGALGFWAFSHRDVLEVMLRLPARAKLDKAVHKRVIEKEWPELLEVPVNEWWGWRKPVKSLSERFTRILKVVREKVALRTRLRSWM